MPKARSTPRANPGKKPTMMALAGKSLWLVMVVVVAALGAMAVDRESLPDRLCVAKLRLVGEGDDVAVELEIELVAVFVDDDDDVDDFALDDDDDDAAAAAADDADDDAAAADDDDDVGPETLRSMAHCPFWQR